jgi:hypothetical protein
MLVAALFFAIGGHWALLQTVAWASMIVEYSHSAPVAEAVEKTFDGRHPCPICKEIQKNQQSEKKHEALQLVKKIELFDEPMTQFVFPSAVSLSLTISDSLVVARADAPPLPPPRVA